MKLGDRVQTRVGWTGEPAAFVGEVEKIHATGPNPQRPECRVRVKLDKPFRSAGTDFDVLTFDPRDLEVIEHGS